MQRAQAIAAKAIADQAAVEAAGASDPSRKRERDAEDPDRAVRARSQSPDRGEPSLLPPQAFSGGGGGGGGGLVIVEGTAGHEGRIIGRGGAMIRELQDRHRVRIQIKRPEGVTEVSGAGADAAAAEIRKIIADAQAGGGGGGGGPTQAPTDPNAVSETIMCDGVESRIIGKGGQNIRADASHGRTFASSPKCTSASSPARRTPWRPRPRRCATSSRISAPRDPRAARVRPAAADTAAAAFQRRLRRRLRGPPAAGLRRRRLRRRLRPPQQGYGGGGGYARVHTPARARELRRVRATGTGSVRWGWIRGRRSRRRRPRRSHRRDWPSRRVAGAQQRRTGVLLEHAHEPDAVRTTAVNGEVRVDDRSVERVRRLVAPRRHPRRTSRVGTRFPSISSRRDEPSRIPLYSRRT